MKHKKIVLLVFGLLIIIGTIVGIIAGSAKLKEKSNDENIVYNETVYDCLSKDNKIEQIENYVFTIAVTNQTNIDWGEEWKDNGVRNFKLKT